MFFSHAGRQLNVFFVVYINNFTKISILKLMKIILLTLVVSSLLLVSCTRSGAGKCTETNVSTASRSSHNRGLDCATCHRSGQSGRGCFTVCGSSFQKDTVTPMQNAVMVLFSKDENGIIIGASKPIPLDKSGNFYTTESTSFAGKYPAIIQNGDTSIMLEPLTNNASCNKCHATNGYQKPIYSQY